MRFDPFRDIDRVLEQTWTQARPASMPMDAYRHGDSFVVHLDLPGVDPASIELSVEQHVLTIQAERHWQTVDDDRPLSELVFACGDKMPTPWGEQLRSS